MPETTYLVQYGRTAFVGRFRAALAGELPRGTLAVVRTPRGVEVGTVLTAGQPFTLCSATCLGDALHACVTYEGLADDLSPGDLVLINDGAIELVVSDTSDGEVHTRIHTGGVLGSHKGVNVPGVTLGVDAITGYDREVLTWAMGADVDYIGQSFVRSASDVDALRSLMIERTLPIVAKIEKHEAVAHIDSIIRAADAVMVARGDLGVETSAEEVPVIQLRVIAAARAVGKPVVIATQMLESMTHSPRPTRAEASDVANAIFGRVDAVMLSGETAVGEYPVTVVETMARIATTAEQALPPAPADGHDVTTDIQTAVSAAVCNLAADLSLAAVVPITESGATALAVARHRPDTLIAAATPTAAVARRLALVWGVNALVMQFSADTDELLEAVAGALLEAKSASVGERVAITAGRSSRPSGGTDFILVRSL